MTVPHWTLPEMFFGILVLTCFATFIVAVAGVHLYTILPRVRRPRHETAPSRAASARAGGRAMSA
jgi:hypothetical protein